MIHIHDFVRCIGYLLAAHGSSHILIGDGFMGLGGSSAKTDRSTYLQGQGALNNVFNYALPTGESATSEAANYNSKILSGDRAAVTQAEAPEINAVTGQADQAKKQQAAMGTSRSGGVNAGNQQRQTQVQGAVTDLIDKARPQAAASQASIGANTLGLGTNAATSSTDEAEKSYGGQYGTAANAARNGSAAASAILKLFP